MGGGRQRPGPRGREPVLPDCSAPCRTHPIVSLQSQANEFALKGANDFVLDGGVGQGCGETIPSLIHGIAVARWANSPASAPCGDVS